MRPEKWDDSQVGFRGSNASGGRIVLLPGAFWAHGASEMATLGASLLPCVLQCSELSQARVARAVLPPGALFRAGAFALPPCASKSHMRRGFPIEAGRIILCRPQCLRFLLNLSVGTEFK